MTGKIKRSRKITFSNREIVRLILLLIALGAVFFMIFTGRNARSRTTVYDLKYRSSDKIKSDSGKKSLMLVFDSRKLRRSGNLVKSLEKADQAIHLMPTNVAAHTARAETLLEMKRYKSALQSINRALELAPENNFSRCIRADIYIAMGDYEKAKSDLRLVLKSENDSPTATAAREKLKKLNLNKKLQ